MSTTDLLFLIVIALAFALFFAGAWAINLYLDYRANLRTDRRLR